MNIEIVGKGGYGCVIKPPITNLININIKREINLLSDLSTLFILINLFYIHKFDIVHSITPKAGLLSMLAAKFLNINKGELIDRLSKTDGVIDKGEKLYKEIVLVKELIN